MPFWVRSHTTWETTIIFVWSFFCSYMCKWKTSGDLKKWERSCMLPNCSAYSFICLFNIRYCRVKRITLVSSLTKIVGVTCIVWTSPNAPSSSKISFLPKSSYLPVFVVAPNRPLFCLHLRHLEYQTRHYPSEMWVFRIGFLEWVPSSVLSLLNERGVGVTELLSLPLILG